VHLPALRIVAITIRPEDVVFVDEVSYLARQAEEWRLGLSGVVWHERPLVPVRECRDG